MRAIVVLGKGLACPSPCLCCLTCTLDAHTGHVERKHVGWADSAGTGRPLLLPPRGDERPAWRQVPR